MEKVFTNLRNEINVLISPFYSRLEGLSLVIQHLMSVKERTPAP